MNIGVFTYYTKEFDALARVTQPHLRRYCARHGYDLTIHRGGFGNRDRNYGYQKTEMVHNLLNGFEILMVIDCDVLITNPRRQLEQFVDDEHLVFATHDENGMNAGIYLIRNSLKSYVFLRHVCAMQRSPSMPGEQDGMRVLLRGLFQEQFKIVPHPSFNSYLYGEYGKTKTHEEGQWEKGDFALHLPGMTNERRIEIFTSPEIQSSIIE